MGELLGKNYKVEKLLKFLKDIGLFENKYKYYGEHAGEGELQKKIKSVWMS